MTSFIHSQGDVKCVNVQVFSEVIDVNRIK